MPNDPNFLGLTVTNWILVAATMFGPIVAVWITMRAGSRRNTSSCYSKRTGSDLSEADIDSLSYYTVGLGQRERLLEDALKGIVRVAETLEAQAATVEGMANKH